MIRIIIVDDEEHILRGLIKLISRIGNQYQVFGAFSSSTDALDYLTENEVDVMITDICMPEIDGLTLCKQAKKLHRMISCILLSGYSDFEYARSAVKIGIEDYLLKPVDDDELRISLSKVLQRKTDFHESTQGYIRSNLSKETTYLKHEIETNYATFDLGACAKRFDKSREYLCKLFKKETGINLPDYLKNIRMQNAKELLEHVNAYRVYEISQHVGFSDPVYFSKQFKKITGMTPKEYQSHIYSKDND